MTPCIFVSYLHKDASVVFPELAWLKDLGLNIWFDEGLPLNQSSSSVKPIAPAALTKLRARTPEDFEPSSRWAQPFPQSVADDVTLASGVSLQELSYNEGLRLMFADLGWGE